MEILLTPGPVSVPAFVMDAIRQPVIHHRTKAFEEMYSALLKGLRYLFQTDSTVATMTGTGTYGVEAAMYSLFRPGEKVLILENGKFSERWANYGKLLGLDVTVFKKALGAGFSVEEVLINLKSESYVGIIATHCETSTATLLDLEELAFQVKNNYPDLILVVDAITTVGAIPFYMDEWQIDCAVVAAQKALMNPAGTIAFALSEQAVDRMQATHHADFRNLYNYVEFARKNSYPYTAPVQLLYGIQAALNYIEEKSLPVVWNQTHFSARLFRQGIASRGGRIFSKSPSDSVTAFFFQDEDNDLIRKKLVEQAGIRISGGQGELVGKIMRVSHMGTSDENAMLRLLEAIDHVR